MATLHSGKKKKKSGIILVYKSPSALNLYKECALNY